MLTSRSRTLTKARTMATDTVYMGHTIRLNTTRSASGRYSGHAVLPELGDRTVRAEGEFATEEEARSAALSRAISEVDHARRFIGKPTR